MVVHVSPRGGSARTGRRPGSQPTRAEILDAARRQFAERGYRAATIRRIAEAAGVDPALIHHYFGSKERLFAATISLPSDVLPGVLASFDRELATAGERLTRTYLGLWEDPATREQMTIVTTMALTNGEAMTHVRSAIGQAIAQIRVSGLPGPDPDVRFQLAMSQLLGVACLRHLAQAPPVSDIPFEDLVARIAPVVQLHLTGHAGAPTA